jgi:toxin ParE1/3/4
VRIHSAALQLIVYRIDRDLMHIIRILGGRQNWCALLEIIDA